MRKRKAICVVGTVILVLAGCRNEAAEPASTATSAAATRTTTSAAPVVPIEGKTEIFVPMEIPILLDKAALGVGTSPAEGVAEEKDSFTASERVRAAMRTREVPSGMVGRVEWLDEDGKTIKEEQKSIPAAMQWVVFDAPALKAGTYKVELYLGGNLVETKPFRVR